MATKIEPYYMVKSPVNGFSFYHYLRIEGGSCNNSNGPNGGDFHFVLYYVAPKDENPGEMDSRFWLKKKKIPFGLGHSVEEAHTDFLKKIIKTPLK